MQKTAYAMRISDWSSDVCSSDLAFGFSSAGVFMVGESWLTSTAPREGRGKVLGLYMILNKGAFGIGQLLLLVGDPSGDRLFMLTAILYTLCLIPVAVMPVGAPAHLGEERLSLMALHRLSPLGVVGAATAGFVNSSRSEEHTSELQSLMRISY